MYISLTELRKGEAVTGATQHQNSLVFLALFGFSFFSVPATDVSWLTDAKTI